METNNITKRYDSPKEFLDELINSSENIEKENIKALHPFIANFLEKYWATNFDKLMNTTSAWSQNIQETGQISVVKALCTGVRCEVPADQYDKIIENYPLTEIFIEKSNLTYKQAKNIAKAGNVDSILYDTKYAFISSIGILGMSGMVSYARYKWCGVSSKEAFRYAINDSIKVGRTSLITNIIGSQLMRTSVARAMTRGISKVVISPLYSTSIGKSTIETLAKASLGRAVYGSAAINHVSKLLRSNVITTGATTLVITAPDVYRAAISGNMSWAQVGKNFVCNASGAAGGAAGWFTCSAAGAALGSVVPVLGTALGGTIGGLIGALGGSVAVGAASKALLDKFVKDDAEEMLNLVQSVFEQLCFDYLLDTNETKEALDKLETLLSPAFLRDVYGASKHDSERKNFVLKEIEPIFEEIVSKRPHITMPTEEEMDEIFADIINILDAEFKKNLDKWILELLINTYKSKHGITIDNILDCVKNSIEQLMNDGCLRLYNGEYFISEKGRNIISGKEDEINKAKEILDNPICLDILNFMMDNGINSYYLIQDISNGINKKYNNVSNVISDLKTLKYVSYNCEHGKYHIEKAGIDYVKNITKNNNIKRHDTIKLKVCISCGAELSDTAKFCPECGVKLVNVLSCPKCGHEGKAGEKFCSECGSKLL